MLNSRIIHRTILLSLLGAILAGDAAALITGSYGNAPVPDRNWRAGAVDVANLKSRVGYWEGPPFGGGEYHFLYRGNSQAFAETLTLFARIRAPQLDLYVHDGPHEDFWLKPASNETDPKALQRDPRVDWEFTIHDAQSWYNLYNNPTSVFDADAPNYRKPLAAPRLDVYVGGGLAEWPAAAIPANIHVVDQRAIALGLDTAGGSIVRGTVYDQATSKTLAGATIEVSRYIAQGKYETLATGQTDAEGRFQIEKLSAGGIRLKVSADGYAERDAANSSLNGRDVGSYDVDLAPQATVSGVVLDAADRPVAGAQITYSEVMGMDGMGYRNADRQAVKTDAQGKFEIHGLPRGYCVLRFSAPGFHPVWNPTPFRTPAKDVVLRAGLTGTVKGRVVLSDGRPRPSGNVDIEEAAGSKIGSWGGSMNVKDDGSFLFENVPVGKYLISTKPFLPGVASEHPTAVTVEAGKTTEVEVPAE
jgi:hypothetical protein